MFKNISGQILAVFAWDNANGIPKTGDAANITAQISIDGGVSASLNDTNPTELDSVDQPGIYIFSLTQAETNGDLLIVSPVSTTDDIVFRPSVIYTEIAQELNGKIVDILEALVYKQVITELTGDVELFDESDVSKGTISNGITSDGTYTTRLKMVL